MVLLLNLLVGRVDLGRGPSSRGVPNSTGTTYVACFGIVLRGLYLSTRRVSPAAAVLVPELESWCGSIELLLLGVNFSTLVFITVDSRMPSVRPIVSPPTSY